MGVKHSYNSTGSHRTVSTNKDGSIRKGAYGQQKKRGKEKFDKDTEGVGKVGVLGTGFGLLLVSTLMYAPEIIDIVTKLIK